MLLINDLENRENMKCYTKDLKNMNARSRTPAENLKKLLNSRCEILRAGLIVI